MWWLRRVDTNFPKFEVWTSSQGTPSGVMHLIRTVAVASVHCQEVANGKMLLWVKTETCKIAGVYRKDCRCCGSSLYHVGAHSFKGGKCVGTTYEH